jgi:hypothetical protein
VEEPDVTQPPSLPKKSHMFQPLPVASAPRSPRAPARTRSAKDSHVRLRALSLPRATSVDYLDALVLLDELGEEQLLMTIDLARLEELVGQASREPSMRAGVEMLRARAVDLRALGAALASVHRIAAAPRLQRIFVPEAPLAEYLRGLHAWGHAVVRALDDLAASMVRLEPDWILLRARIEEAKNFHFDELHGAARADLAALAILAEGGAFGDDGPPVEELRCAVERLFALALAFEAQLDDGG